MQASHIHPVNSSKRTSVKYLGVLCRADFDNLPEDLKKIAVRLAQSGRFDIQNMPIGNNADRDGDTGHASKTAPPE